jgi:phospholipase A2
MSIAWYLHLLYTYVTAGAEGVLFEKIRAQYMQHPYATMQATVRVGSALCQEEAAYCTEREKTILTALEKLGIKLNSKRVPRIALCLSGGGYRAMMSTLGGLKALEDAGLLDAIMYQGAVSGSTWAVAPWLKSGLTIGEYRDQLARSSNSHLLENDNSKQITQALIKQYAFTGMLSTIDFYGALLAQKLLHQYANPQDIALMERKNKQVPLPIYTAIIPVKSDHEWLEFTPYEAGSSYLRSYVPIWAFGRTFFAGKSQDFNPPQSLGFCLGFWGSGVSANIRELLELYKERFSSQFVWRTLMKFAEETPLTEARIFPAHAANWNLGMDLPLSSEDRLTLLDAGIDFGLPFPPLLRPEREVDILIVFDATYYPIVGTDLLNAERYAREHKLPFPHIDADKLDQSCSLHISTPLNMSEMGSLILSDSRRVQRSPVVIYFPLVKDPEYLHGWDPRIVDFTSTSNFKYTQEQFMMVSGLMEHAVRKNIQTIISTIEQYLDGSTSSP